MATADIDSIGGGLVRTIAEVAVYPSALPVYARVSHYQLLAGLKAPPPQAHDPAPQPEHVTAYPFPARRRLLRRDYRENALQISLFCVYDLTVAKADAAVHADG